MKEFVGVKPLISFQSSSLKREALMFNRVAVPRYTEFLNAMRFSQSFGVPVEEPIMQFITELEWLIDKGIFFEPEPLLDERLSANEEFSGYSRLENVSFNEAVAVLKSDKLKPKDAESACRLIESVNNRQGQPFLSLFNNYYQKLSISHQYHARKVSIQLRELNSMDAYPILDTDIPSTQESEAAKSDVVQIVFDALPIPDDSTSLEQVLDYRSDTDSQKKFSNLRHWMNKFAKGQLTRAESEEEIEHLINEYENHLKHHKLKITTTRIAVVLQVGAAIFEQKVGLIATGIVTYLLGRIGLLEGESKAPGKEIAYIVQARERFS